MRQNAKKPSSTRIKLYLNLALFLLFIVISSPQTTQIALHEWLGIFFIIPMLVHLLMSWKWISNIARRILTRLPGETRFNQVWDLLLFTIMTLVIFTGIAISERALPVLGIPIHVDRFWRNIHTTLANLLMVMIGIHLTMHRKWIVRTFRRYLLRRPVRPSPVNALSGD